MRDNFAIETRVLIADLFKKNKTAKKFLKRLKDGKYTREENPHSHFCVYFAAYDPKQKQVFLGHHKKSGLWLFNGGHIDKGELPQEALEREIDEEWGLPMSQKKIGPPKLLTVTQIENPAKQICKVHFDIWYFVGVDQSSFTPDQKLLEKEFYETRWFLSTEARKIARDPNTIAVINFLGNQLF